MRRLLLVFLCVLLVASTVARVELIYTSSGVNELLLTREKWVRVAADLELYEGVLIAIFPGNGVFGLDGRTRYEGVIGRNIFENDFSVFRMDSFFHCF